LEAVPWKHSIDLLQKAAILGKSHVIRKVLLLKIEALSMGIVVFAEETYKKEKDGDKRLIIIIIIIIIIIVYALGVLPNRYSL